MTEAQIQTLLIHTGSTWDQVSVDLHNQNIRRPRHNSPHSNAVKTTVFGAHWRGGRFVGKVNKRDKGGEIYQQRVEFQRGCWQPQPNQKEDVS